MLPRCPKIMQIFWGYQKKMFIVYKVCDFVGKVKISFLRGWGGKEPTPQESAHFGATASAQEHLRFCWGT